MDLKDLNELRRRLPSRLDLSISPAPDQFITFLDDTEVWAQEWFKLEGKLTNPEKPEDPLDELVQKVAMALQVFTLVIRLGTNPALEPFTKRVGEFQFPYHGALRFLFDTFTLLASMMGMGFNVPHRAHLLTPIIKHPSLMAHLRFINPEPLRAASDRALRQVKKDLETLTEQYAQQQQSTADLHERLKVAASQQTKIAAKEKEIRQLRLSFETQRRKLHQKQERLRSEIVALKALQAQPHSTPIPSLPPPARAPGSALLTHQVQALQEERGLLKHKLAQANRGKLEKERQLKSLTKALSQARATARGETQTSEQLRQRLQALETTLRKNQERHADAIAEAVETAVRKAQEQAWTSALPPVSVLEAMPTVRLSEKRRQVRLWLKTSKKIFNAKKDSFQ